MALTVTPGASNADSYATLAEADAYFTARGIATWTGTDAVKEQALRRATAYLDNQYRGRWVGIRTNETQSLAWPRMGDVSLHVRDSLTYSLLDIDGFEIPSDSVPTQIKHAQIEAALLILTGSSLEPTLPRGGMVKRERKKVGPLEKETEWQDGASAIDRYTVIEGLLRGLVTGTPGASVGNVRLVRG